MTKKKMIGLMILFSLIVVQVTFSTTGDNPLKEPVLGDHATTIESLGEQLSKATGQDFITLLLRRGEAYREKGHYLRAEADCKTALETAKASRQQLLEIVASQSLGYVYFLQQKYEMAESFLRTAFKKANQLDEPVLAAVCANRLGNVLYKNGQKENAYRFYQNALDLIRKGNDPGLEAAIFRNIAHMETDNILAFDCLQTAQKNALTVADSFEQARLLLGIAAEAGAKDPDNEHLEFRYQTLGRALTLANRINSARMISISVGEMGKLYEGQRRFNEALIHTEQAVEAAQRIEAHELLLQWEWQMGRILRARGEREKAISCLWRAVYHIQEIRQDIPDNSGDARSSFRENLSPIYLVLADMLLVQSGDETDEHIKQRLLKKAQEAVENMKRSQLRDYFKDPCIDALSEQIESLAPGTAVIYPIILPDRLELLADIGGKLYRRSTDIKKEILQRTITVLVRNMRSGSFYKKSSETVYSWLISPLTPLLDKQNIDTLIFVPDGVFRMLPIASLFNGKTFLVEKYAVATEPGLTLLDPNPLPRGDMKTLLAGMSKPGPVVLDLPDKLWETLSKTHLSQKKSGVRGLTITSEQLAVSDKSNSSPQSQGETAEHIKQVLSLPGVDKEIEGLSGSLPNQMLFNDAFLLDRFSAAIKEQDYRIIHIASHGFFGGTPEQNFVMTYDKCLNMNRLEEYIKPKQLVARPVELITLSACQTAEGDDRSPLGLAGVALKSGARSVIGSLWPVSDTATQQLLAQFYSQLKDEKVTKAQALQRAQKELIKNINFEHPFFWSAFILVGNWL